MAKRGLFSGVLVLLLVLACGFGALVFPTPAREQRMRIKNRALAERLALQQEHREELGPWLLGGKIAIGVIFLGVAAGLGSAAVVYAWRKAEEIRPDDAGLYPLIRIDRPGVTVIHDPNRAIAPTTVYTTPELARHVAIVPMIAPGMEANQVATTARAQAVQLAAAVHRHLSTVETNNAPLLPPSDSPQVANFAHLWPSRVPLASLLNETAVSLTQLVLGITVNEETGQSEIVTGDMAKLVHVAVGGSSGWGKSVFLRALAYQLALAAERPDLVMVDLEGVTFAPFAQSSRLLYPIADTERDALAVFGVLTGELDRRKQLFNVYPGVDSLNAYSARTYVEPLHPIVALVDEATALLGDKDVESATRTLTLRGRKYGLWLVLGGQDWKASSLDTAIRNQLSARVQFKAMSASQSRVLLEQAGAEALDVPGRALAVLPGRGTIKLQAPYIGAETIIATLTEKGPQNPMPEASEETKNVEQEALIRKLAEEGLSRNEIQRQVFGYTGGAAHAEVKHVLDGE